MRRWLAGNVWFPVQERIKGHPTLRILKEMEAADHLSPAELQEVQQHRLEDLIAHSFRSVPFIRDRMRRAGIIPADIRAVADLRQLPLMTKSDVRANRATLHAEGVGPLTQFTTGGSTGEPLIFDLGKRRIASRVACRQRVSRWWGVSIGDSEVALWASPVELSAQDWIRAARDWLFATRLLSAFEMNEQTVSRYLDLLERHGCRQIFGYPSAIYMLCAQAQKQGRDLRSVGVKVAFVTGEVLLPFQRALITKTLNCGVADGYGGRDSGFIAHECPEGGMHVLSDAVITEILDESGRPAVTGESGQIVVTDLYSHDFPFIRYATGDIAVASGRVCPCGRPLPLLERIEGRSNDMIIAPDGRHINSLALIYPLRELEGVVQYRIRQTAPDSFEVQWVVGEALPPEAESRIRNAWSQLLRTSVRVRFDAVASIPVERSGKFRHVVSELAGGMRAGARG